MLLLHGKKKKKKKKPLTAAKPFLLVTQQVKFAEQACPDWRVENRWFVNQSGLKVTLQKRQGVDN